MHFDLDQPWKVDVSKLKSNLKMLLSKIENFKEKFYDLPKRGERF